MLSFLPFFFDVGKTKWLLSERELAKSQYVYSIYIFNVQKKLLKIKLSDKWNQRGKSLSDKVRLRAIRLYIKNWFLNN